MQTISNGKNVGQYSNNSESGVKAKLVPLIQAFGLLWRKMITVISDTEGVQFFLWNSCG